MRVQRTAAASHNPGQILILPSVARLAEMAAHYGADPTKRLFATTDICPQEPHAFPQLASTFVSHVLHEQHVVERQGTRLKGCRHEAVAIRAFYSTLPPPSLSAIPPSTVELAPAEPTHCILASPYRVGQYSASLLDDPASQRRTCCTACRRFGWPSCWGCAPAVPMLEPLGS